MRTLTYKSLEIIKFPVYKLFSDNIRTIDGLVFIEDKLLDDTNMPGRTLGMRRLQTPQNNVHPLKKGVMDAVTMLKSNHNLFIDSSGMIFIYEKTLYQPLKHYKIKRVELKEVASLVWFFELSYPFKVPRPPPHGAYYARILFFKGTPWVIYDFVSERGKDTRRMV